MGTRTSGGFEPLEKKIKQEFFPGIGNLLENGNLLLATNYKFSIPFISPT